MFHRLPSTYGFHFPVKENIVVLLEAKTGFLLNHASSAKWLEESHMINANPFDENVICLDLIE